MSGSGRTDFDDVHALPAGGAGEPQGDRLAVGGVGILRRFIGCDVKQCPSGAQILSTLSVGEKTVVPDAVEPRGQDVKKETPDKLRRSEGHGLEAVVALGTIIFPAEHDTLGVVTEQP